MIGEVLALGAAVSFAINNVFIQRGLAGSTPTISAFLGNLISMLLLAVGTSILWFTGQMPPIPWQALALFASAGIFTAGLGRITEALSIETIGASRTSSIRMLDPLFGYALSIAFLGDRLELRPALGIILVIIGLQIIAGDGGNAQRMQSAPTGRGVYSRGLFVAVTSSLLYASGNILRKSGMTLVPSAMIGSTVAVLVGLGMSAITVIRSPHQRERLRTISRASLTDFAISATAATSGQYLVFAALGISTVPVVSTLRNTAPWFTMLLGVLFLGARDRITGRLALSTVMVMAGVVLVIFR